MGLFKGLTQIITSPLRGVAEVFDDISGENDDIDQSRAIERKKIVEETGVLISEENILNFSDEIFSNYIEIEIKRKQEEEERQELIAEENRKLEEQRKVQAEENKRLEEQRKEIEQEQRKIQEEKDRIRIEEENRRSKEQEDLRKVEEEKQRIADEKIQKEKEEAKLNKKKNYQEFLSKNEYKEGKDFYIKKEDTEILLYSLKDTFKL